MEATKILVCLVLHVCGFVKASVLPVEKCTLTDKACMVPAFQKMLPVFVKGLPEYGVDVMDPLTMNDLKFDLSGLTFSLSGGTLKGLQNAIVDDVNWDVEKKVFSFDFHTDATIKGHYTASGQVLVLPISGDGQFKMKLKNMKIKMIMHYDIVKNGDKEHLKITKSNFDYVVKDNANFNLSNLFNGNKELSTALLNFLNENWQQISSEFGRPMADVAVKQVREGIKNLFEKLPLEDIANV